MNDFEIQRELRQMNTPHAPQSDLWPAIATRIAAGGQAAHRRWLPLAAAAGLVLAVAGTLMFGVHESTAPLARTGTDTGAGTAQKLRLSPRDFARAPGGDPRLVGASVVLDAAHAELEQALDQRPDAVFLVSLLNRTNAQRMKLEHFGARAG
ncbi:MAG: hypothetical protein ACHP7D_09970 [Lysobacterales bacterium]